MKKFLALLLLTGILTETLAQQPKRYLVKLKDKNGTPYSLSNPLAYLSERAINRRNRYGIPIDSTDLPVNLSYIVQIGNVDYVTVLNASKWLNSVTIQISDTNAVAAAIATINGFSFVQSVSAIALRINSANDQPSSKKLETITQPLNNSTARSDQVMADYFNYGTNSFNEIHLHNGEFLHNIGLRGQGMQIAVLDAGFTNYTTLDAFDSVIANNQVLSTWDFVSGHADVNDNSHGMQCFSTIAANIPGQFVGMAPKANFYLYRTEDAVPEYPIEEHNWVCGAERGDSAGTDIISTSLGYTDFDPPLEGSSHVYADMNGNTTMAAIGADLAAKKGILVFASVGNSGNDSWHFLGSPSDGDSVIAVGAVNVSGVVGGFSSYGPSSDGQVKPDIASVGVNAIVQGTNNTIGTNNGTSFSCPKMAGLGTCLWQGFPEFNNMKIRNALWQAGSISGAPNDRIGYGIPNMKTAFVNLLADFATSSSSLTGCRVTINWTSKDIAAMKYEIERKGPADANYSKVGDMSPQAGTLLANHNYQFNNDLTSGSSGLFSYRIRQIVDTAAASFTAAYIDTTSITLSSACIVTGTNPVDPVTEKVTLIPNPAYNSLTLKVQTINAIPNLSIHIIDMKGGVVMKFNRTKAPGIQNFDLPVYRLAKGKYVVTVYDGKKLLAAKELIKL